MADRAGIIEWSVDGSDSALQQTVDCNCICADVAAAACTHDCPFMTSIKALIRIVTLSCTHRCGTLCPGLTWLLSRAVTGEAAAQQRRRVRVASGRRLLAAVHEGCLHGDVLAGGHRCDHRKRLHALRAGLSRGAICQAAPPRSAALAGLNMAHAMRNLLVAAANSHHKSSIPSGCGCRRHQSVS